MSPLNSIPHPASVSGLSSVSIVVLLKESALESFFWMRKGPLQEDIMSAFRERVLGTYRLHPSLSWGQLLLGTTCQNKSVCHVTLRQSHTISDGNVRNRDRHNSESCRNMLLVKSPWGRNQSRCQFSITFIIMLQVGHETSYSTCKLAFGTTFRYLTLSMWWFLKSKITAVALKSDIF